MKHVHLGFAVMLLTGCTGAAKPGPPPWAPPGGVSEVELDGRTLHYANVLGLPRAQIERGLPPGWASPIVSNLELVGSA